MGAAPAPFSLMARFIRCPSPVMTTRQFTTGTWITATSISGRWLKTSPEAAWTHGMEFAWTSMSGGPRCPAGCHPAAQGMAGHIRTDRRSGGAFGEAGRGDRGCVPAHRLPGRRRRAGSRGRSGGAVPGLAPGLRGNGLRRDTLPGRPKGVTRASSMPPESRGGVSRKDAGLAWPRARRSWAGTNWQPLLVFTASWTKSTRRRTEIRDPAQKSTWWPLTGADPAILCPEGLGGGTLQGHESRYGHSEKEGAMSENTGGQPDQTTYELVISAASGVAQPATGHRT